MHADFISNNEIGDTIIDYRKVTPKSDGSCDYEAVLCVDVKGSIPSSLQRLSASIQVKSVENTIYLIRHG